MDAFISARIPIELKKQGNVILKEIGATPTQLVNSAYEYLLKNRALPNALKQSSADPLRRLSALQIAELNASIAATTFDVGGMALQEKNYKDILSEGRTADYEALA